MTTTPRRATAHFRLAAHPVIRSYEPGEDWYRCSRDQFVFESRVPAGPVAAMTDRAALMSMFDYDARPVTPGVILVDTIGAEPGQASRS